MKRPIRYLVVAACAAAWACTPGTTSGGVSTTPLTPAPSVAAAPSAGPSGSPLPVAETLPPGVFFREEFDGDRVDPARWKVFEREGQVRVKDGALELLAGGLTRTFPVVVPTGDNIPKEGPFYLEVRYQIIALGKISGFNLDFLAPASADDPGITEPFLRWGTFQNELMFVMDTETRNYGPVAYGGSLSPQKPHRFRLEYDDEGTYRVIFDEAELQTVPSRRRPTKLWIGPYPNTPVAPTAWASWKIAAIETGVLVTPDPAKPRAVPTPRPTATPASPTPAPSPSGAP